MQIHADKRAAILKFYTRKTADRKRAIFRRIPARREKLIPANTQAYTEAGQKAKRGMKKPTQPTIAHDETHEAGELIGCPLWNCKSTNIPSKTKKLLLLT